jgi:hypothetical protein
MMAHGFSGRSQGNKGGVDAVRRRLVPVVNSREAVGAIVAQSQTKGEDEI